jgi:hypothetical protein
VPATIRSRVESTQSASQKPPPNAPAARVRAAQSNSARAGNSERSSGSRSARELEIAAPPLLLHLVAQVRDDVHARAAYPPRQRHHELAAHLGHGEQPAEQRVGVDEQHAAVGVGDHVGRDRLAVDHRQLAGEVAGPDRREVRRVRRVGMHAQAPAEHERELVAALARAQEHLAVGVPHDAAPRDGVLDELIRRAAEHLELRDEAANAPVDALTLVGEHQGPVAAPERDAGRAGALAAIGSAGCVRGGGAPRRRMALEHQLHDVLSRAAGVAAFVGELLHQP